MMTYVWIGVFIAALVIESATVRLVSVWFAVGALASFILSVCRVDSLWIQITVFTLVSLISLAAARPLIKKLVRKTKREFTRADMYIGLEGIATEKIDNFESTGLVKVKGSVRSAKSRSDEVISAGARVKVLSADGVKLVVEEIKEG